MGPATATYRWRLDALNWAQIERQLQQLDQDDTGSDPARPRLHCAHCERFITTEDQRIVQSGRHEHRFDNPHGLSFHIGCFAQALGCGAVGVATEQWTWFPGYAWQIALCLSCGLHLGWRYRGRGGDGFYGLILDRLVVKPTP